MLTILEDELIYNLLQLLIVLTALIFLISMRVCIVNARKKLVPTLISEDGKIADPDRFNINANARSIDPFENQ